MNVFRSMGPQPVGLLVFVFFTLQLLVREAAAADKEPSVVKINLVDGSDSTKNKRYRIDVPNEGYPGENKHRSLHRDEDGRFVFSGVGDHTLMVTDEGASGYWKRFVEVSLPSEIEIIKVPVTAPQRQFNGKPRPEAKIDVGEVTVRVNDFEVRPTLRVAVTNKSDQRWPIGDLSAGDAELVGNDFRVFIPSGLFKDPGAIQSGQQYSVVIDWPVLVEKGLWISREGEVKAEPELPDDKDNLGFRLKIWGQTTKAFQLPRPETVLADLAAMKKAIVQLQFGKPSYFIGQHMQFHVIVRNEADREIRVNWGGDSRAPRPLRFKIIVVNESTGKRAVDPHPNPFCMGGMGSTQNVPPGGEYDMGELALQSYCTISEPGAYAVNVYHDLGWEPWCVYHDDGPVPQLENRLPKVDTLAPIAVGKVIVKRPTDKDAAAVIEEMRENFSDGYLSSKVFASLQSNAYLPALKTWVAENGGSLGLGKNDRHEEFYGRTAIAGVGGIMTVEATEFLVELLKHEDPVVVRDAFRVLSRRLPHPAMKEKIKNPLIRKGADPKHVWRDEFREPILEFAFRQLADPQLPAANTQSQPVTERERRRRNRIQASSVLQSVAKQDDYPRLRNLAMKVIQEYRDHEQENCAYPRPVTATVGLAAALWFSFCDGNAEYSPQLQDREFVFSTEDLESLFEDGQIDPFTMATLLSSVDSFRPDGWRDWVVEQLRSEVPWIRCHVMEKLLEPDLPANRKAVADNIASRCRAVQAAAIHVAQSHPSVMYIPSLKRAIAAGDRWIKPIAETALVACQASENARRANRAPQTVKVVKTWQQLLEQPEIKLAEGTARLGVDTSDYRKGGAVLLYCLTQGYRTPDQWEEDNCLGPFRISIVRPRKTLIEHHMMHELRKHVETRDARVLFRRTIPISDLGETVINVATQDGQVVASLQMEVSKKEVHPWSYFERLPLGDFVLDEQFDAVARWKPQSKSVAAKFDGKSPLVFRRNGNPARFATNDDLPGLVPRDQKLRLANVEGRVLIESREPFLLNSPHDRFLVRWWVNGKPHTLNAREARQEAEMSEKMINGKTLLVAIDIDGKDFGLAKGDKLEMQVMYCKYGWEAVDDPLKLVQAAMWDSEEPELLLSNRLDVSP